MQNSLLVQYEVEIPCEATFRRCFVVPATTSKEDIALDVLDAIDGSPTYTVDGDDVDSNIAANALLSGMLVRRDYHDGDDMILFDLRIREISEEDLAVLRQYEIV